MLNIKCDSQAKFVHFHWKRVPFLFVVSLYIINMVTTMYNVLWGELFTVILYSQSTQMTSPTSTKHSVILIHQCHRQLRHLFVFTLQAGVAGSRQGEPPTQQHRYHQGPSGGRQWQQPSHPTHGTRGCRREYEHPCCFQGSWYKHCFKIYFVSL